jgi:DNA-binding transcriptional MerR regulator
VPEDERYSLTELADLAGVTPRTVRYYLAQGLLPAVGQSGPGAKYDDRHFARLRLIRRLQAEHLPLAEIRRRLDELGDDEIGELAGSTQPPAPRDSALEYLRGVLAGPPTAKPRRRFPDFGVSVPPPLRAHGLSVAPVAASRFDPDTVPEFSPPGVADFPAPYASPPMVPPAFVPSIPEPSPMERSQWDRIALSPDVELHIRRPLGRAQQKQVDRLVAIARELLEEERP